MPDLSTRQTLTDLTVKRIRPTDSRVEYPDSVVPGLRLIVQPSGAKSWALRTRVAGKVVKVTLLGADGVTDARERARKALEKAGAGERPVASLLKPMPAAPVPAVCIPHCDPSARSRLPRRPSPRLARLSGTPWSGTSPSN